MERKIQKRLTEWKNDPYRKPLVILGCRQVGKTFTVKDFGEKEYDSVIYLNFADSPDDRLIFEGDLDTASVMDRILLSRNIDLSKGKTLLVMDEIQDCENAYYSLKPLSSERRLDIIATGSFLGILLDSKKRKGNKDEHRISPMGYVTLMNMYPMDFEEFAWAMGVRKDLLNITKECILNEKPVDPYFNKMLSDLFRRYLVVGGMPAAVRAYAETGDYSNVIKRLNDIVSILKLDAGRYSSKKDIMRIHACLESIPSQLADDNRWFQYNQIEKIKGTGEREYGTALDWLENAGITLRCRNLLSLIPPLDENADNDSFKLYVCDTGILMALCGFRDVQEIITDDPFTNKGTVMENAIAVALIAKGYPLFHYAKKNSTLEVDFVIRYKDSTCILEIKSGRKKRSKSLNTLLAEKDRKRIGYKVCTGNVSRDDNGAVHIPLYGPSLLMEKPLPVVGSVDIDSMNRTFEERIRG